jgi:hypothetical protein
MRRTILLLVGALVAVLLTAPPAAASTPTIVHREPFAYTTPEFFGVSCTGFDVLFTASGVVTTKDFYDASGAFVREEVQFWFTGTLYNSSDLSKTVPYQGRGFINSWADGIVVNNDTYLALIDGTPVLLEAANYYNGSQSPSFLHGVQKEFDLLCRCFPSLAPFEQSRAAVEEHGRSEGS